jgi:hypothetical protein
MDARRPNMQENGREMAIALDPICEICPHDDIRNSDRLGRGQLEVTKLTRSSSRKEK